MSAMKRTARLLAKETMQKFNYDPIEVLVMCAQEAGTTSDTKVKIAETLLPYMYPKLSNVTLDAEVSVDQAEQNQGILMRKILDDPELADAAQRLSIAAAQVALDNMGAAEVDGGSGLIN